MNMIRLCVTALLEHMPISCYPGLDACKRHLGISDAVFEYWKGTFLDRIPTVDCNGRGWGIKLNQKTHDKYGKNQRAEGWWRSQGTTVVHLRGAT